MENYIVIGIDGAVKCSINNNIMEHLKAYKPKGCPFENYSMFDLLKDWIQMYSWQMTERKISLIDFIGKIKGDGKVELYRETMGMLLLI